MNDTELYSEVVRTSAKLFYCDLKQNARGKYAKIAEKGTHRAKSSVVVPGSGVAQFAQLMRFYLDEADAGRVASAPQDLIVESKVFSFQAGSNDRGHFLRVFERGGGFPTGGSSLMIPNGPQNACLRTFCECLSKIAAMLGGEEGIEYQPTAPSILTPSAPDVVSLESKETGPVLSVGPKHFFFETRENARGTYVRIKEVSGGMRNAIVIPLAAIEQFKEALHIASMQPPQDGAPGHA